MEAYAILIVIYMVMAGINAVRKSGNGGKRRGAPPVAGGPQQGRRGGPRQAARPAQRQAPAAESPKPQGGVRERAAQSRPTQSIPAQNPRGTERMPQSQGRPAAGSRRGQPLPAPGQFAASGSGIPPAPSSPKMSRPVAGQPTRKEPRRPGARQGAGLPKTAGQAELAATKTTAKAPAKGTIGNAGSALNRNVPLDLRQGIIWSQILGEPRSRQLRYGRARRPN
ncbi:MAG: hypothetical protein AAGU12_04955 [Clostridiales bacterium]